MPRHYEFQENFDAIKFENPDMPDADAQELAVESMAKKYPRLFRGFKHIPKTFESTAKDGVSIPDFDGDPKKLQRSVLWVGNHLYDENPNMKECPDKFALLMLRIFRKGNDSDKMFFKECIARTLPSAEEIERMSKLAANDERIEECLADVEKFLDKSGVKA